VESAYKGEGADTFQVLGSAPLCEASASIVLDGPSARVLVADNEYAKALFFFAINTDDEATLSDMRLIALPKPRLQDIESMALRGDELYLVGSHSRNKQGELKAKRMRLHRYLLRGEGSELSLGEELRVLDSSLAWEEQLADVPSCLERFFVGAAERSAEEVEICEALVDAQVNASNPRGIDIEGAAFVGERLWLGFRAPTVAGSSLLMRVLEESLETPSDALGLRFDAAVLVASEGQLGRGVRELQLRGALLLVVVGPEADGDEGHALLAVDSDALQPGARLVGRELAQLPEGSEAVVPVEGGVVALMDGAKGKTEAQCKKAAGQHFVSLTD
jgi:hypothetical protein